MFADCFVLILDFNSINERLHLLWSPFFRRQQIARVESGGRDTIHSGSVPHNTEEAGPGPSQVETGQGPRQLEAVWYLLQTILGGREGPTTNDLGFSFISRMIYNFGTNTDPPPIHPFSLLYSYLHEVQ